MRWDTNTYAHTHTHTPGLHLLYNRSICRRLYQCLPRDQPSAEPHTGNISVHSDSLPAAFCKYCSEAAQIKSCWTHLVIWRNIRVYFIKLWGNFLYRCQARRVWRLVTWWEAEDSTFYKRVKNPTATTYVNWRLFKKLHLKLHLLVWKHFSRVHNWKPQWCENLLVFILLI